MSRHCVHCNLHNNLNWAWLLKDNVLNKSRNVMKHVPCFNIIAIDHSLCIITSIFRIYGHPIPLILDESHPSLEITIRPLVPQSGREGPSGHKWAMEIYMYLQTYHNLHNLIAFWKHSRWNLEETLALSQWKKPFSGPSETDWSSSVYHSFAKLLPAGPHRFACSIRSQE